MGAAVIMTSWTVSQGLISLGLDSSWTLACECTSSLLCRKCFSADRFSASHHLLKDY